MDPVAEQLHKERQERISNAPSTLERNVCLIAGLPLVIGCVVLGLLHPPAAAPNLPLVAALIAAYALFWQIEFEVGPISTSPLQVVFVPMWFAVSPEFLPLAVIAAQLLGLGLSALLDRDRTSAKRILVNGTFAWFAVGPAVILSVFGASTFSVDHLWVYALALAAQFVVDAASAALRLIATRRTPTPVSDLRWMFMIDASLAPLGLVTALAIANGGSWALACVLPLGLLLAQFAKERDERILNAVQLSNAYRGTAQLMGDVLEADDAYTGGEHTKGVVGLALALGGAIRLNARQMRDLEFGALLHDIGKLRVPNEIINKPGKLTEEEWEIIKLHPGYGQEMLDRVGGELTRAGVIVRAHHERWDGGGYPDGLAGEEIPVEARIITICDSFSAMTTDRSYRKGMSAAEALEELRRCAGTQFDPKLVEALFQELGEPHPRPVVFTKDGVRATLPPAQGERAA